MSTTWSARAAKRFVLGEEVGCVWLLGVGLCLVERWLARDWSRWPLTRAEEIGGCLRTWADVRSGQVDSKLASIALHHVERAGENIVAW